MATAGRKFETSGMAADGMREPLTMVPPPARETTNLSQETAQSSAAELAEKAYRALHIGFVALPLVAGIDKFANELAEWGEYLAPVIPGMTSISTPSFMFGVGVFEILMAIGIALKPRVFADLFAAYMVAIIVNLMVYGQYYDVALFDFALAAGACALARLSAAKERGNFGRTADDFGGASSERRAA